LLPDKRAKPDKEVTESSAAPVRLQGTAEIDEDVDLRIARTTASSAKPAAAKPNHSRKNRKHMKELSYLMEEEQLLADLKRKSEDTLQKLKVEELTLLRYVRGLAANCSDPNQPIVIPDPPLPTSTLLASSFVTTTTPIVPINTANPVSPPDQALTVTTTVAAPSKPTAIVSPNNMITSTLSQIEQTVNSTALLSLNVNDLLLGMEQEPEMDDDDEDEENIQSYAKMQN
jgi:hypothetical protein